MPKIRNNTAKTFRLTNRVGTTQVSVQLAPGETADLTDLELETLRKHRVLDSMFRVGLVSVITVRSEQTKRPKELADRTELNPDQPEKKKRGRPKTADLEF